MPGGRINKNLAPAKLKKQRRIWRLAVEDGLTTPATLGEGVLLPDADWEEYWHRAGTWTLPQSVPVPEPAQRQRRRRGETPDAAPPEERELLSIAARRRRMFDRARKSTHTTSGWVSRIVMTERTDDPDEQTAVAQMRDQLNAAAQAMVEYVDREQVAR